MHFPTEDYQLEMMRHLRKVNVDHLSVGWYQSTQLGNFITTQLLESQFSYQTSIEESVVLIYGMWLNVIMLSWIAAVKLYRRREKRDREGVRNDGLFRSELKKL